MGLRGVSKPCLTLVFEHLQKESDYYHKVTAANGTLDMFNLLE